ncbi:MAG: heat-inducible transcriptional repressor HrcA [Anaerolineae bacterium]|nr:heat-inducible transcriptional repressor HrcA [Anaerolineae bacterium]MCO5193228.1 heat-inducible transcriptional repressor HrcA [Anaerolineae bacterium]MCO5205479.1 heat-inducible transcriptional repressor HrcA [Anaerolineae bacterium]
MFDDVFHPLTERQQTILGLIVRSFVESGRPLGSKTLVDRYNLDVSSATIRNEMSLLTDLGYIHQLHTSAGRIPTEKGYRFFVQRLVGEFELPLDDRQMIMHQFHQARLDLEQWMQLAAAVLARISHGASFVTAPRPRFSVYKHVQLISTTGRQVLMIFVLHGGEIKQQILTLATPILQQRLSEAATRLNTQFEGKNLDQIQARLGYLDELEQDVTRLVLEVMRRVDTRTISRIYRDGIANILDDETTRPAVKLLEERTLLGDIVAELVETEESGVNVIIGGEGRWEELRHCTLIVSRYGIGEDLTGEIAVVGSTRMPYGRNISAVRYVADIMSGFLSEYLVE